MIERGPGPQSQKIVREEGEWLAPGIQRLATLAGVAMSAGQGCVLEDADGREYLDFMAGVGVASLGHSHPRWTSAISSQASKLAVGSMTPVLENAKTAALASDDLITFRDASPGNLFLLEGLILQPLHPMVQGLKDEGSNMEKNSPTPSSIFVTKY